MSTTESGQLFAPISSNPPVDVVASPDGSKLYVADADGAVREYDVATRALLSTWQVGSDLGGIDISPDGTYLMVVGRDPTSQHAETNSAAAYETVQVFKVSTLDGSVTSIPVNVTTSYEIDAYDISVLDNDTAILTVGDSNEPILYINTTTGASSGAGTTYGGTGVLYSSDDHSETLLSGSNTSDAPLVLFDNTGTRIYAHWSYEDNIQGYTNGIVALSTEGGLVVQQTYSKDINGDVHTNLFVYDAHLNYKFDLLSMHPEFADGNISGLAFNKSGTDLYVLDNDTNQIVDISTSTWATVRSYNVGTTIGDATVGHYGNRLIVTADGQSFIVTTENGIQLVANAGVANDFNADGHSDILWRNDNGALTEWQVSGSTDQLTANAYSNNAVSTEWHVAETFDFNGDGASDILWRNVNTGAFTVWEGGGNSFVQNAYTSGTVGTDWSVAAVGDLNGDGKDDIVWHNANGALTTWLSTGVGFEQNAYSNDTVPPNWQIVGTGDFNGDGKADLLWRNQVSGAFTEWQSNGTSFAENAYVNDTVDQQWHVQAIADFDGDGKADLLWRNATTGQFTIWSSTGTGFMANTYVDNSVGNDWQIAQTSDFNGDGKADILWRNTTSGTFTLWQSNGHGFDENVVVQSGVGTDWHIQGHDYLFG